MNEQDPTNDPTLRRDGATGEPTAATGEPTAATVGAGTGAAGGALAGAALGTAIAGPVGLGVGAVVGGVAGAYGGTRIATALYPAEEESYWREHHAEEPWAENGSTYDEYADAYRTGYNGYLKYPGKDYDEIEPELEKEYGQSDANRVVSWDRARPALKASWRRAAGLVSPRAPGRGLKTGI